jgi:transcriptional regulator with XRE-family HTH domain
LKHLRAQEDLTQCELAQRSGVPHATIRDIECGRYDGVMVSTVVGLKRALGCTADAIIGP